MARFRDVLKNKNFLLLWLGQLASNFGDRLTQMALVALVYQRAPGSEMALAKLISFTIIPVFIVGPVAGVWVDRLNRRNIMILCDIIRGLLILAIPLFVIFNNILPIYFIVFLTFTLSRFFIPSKMAMIPDIVSEDKLLVANTLQDSTHMIGNVIGLVVAGIIVNMPRVGAIGGFYIDAATFFLSACMIAMITHKRIVRDLSEDLKITKEALSLSIRKGVFEEIREGVKFLLSYRQMRFVVWTLFVLMAGIGAVSCVIIVFVQKAFGNATRDLGFLGMALAAGLLAGTIIYGRLGQRVEKRNMILISLVASGASIMLFTLLLYNRAGIIAALAASAVLGVSVSPVMVAINTLTHETVSNEVRGRIFSSLEVVIHLAFLIFMLMTAYAARYIEGIWILLFTGGVYILAGIAGAFYKKVL